MGNMALSEALDIADKVLRNDTAASTSEPLNPINNQINILDKKGSKQIKF